MTRLQKHFKSFLLAEMVLIALIGMLGCATTNPEQKTLTTHEMLVTAGFTYKVANTPEQREQFSKMPQEKLLRHARKDKTVYYYADVSNCNCVFVGDDAAVKRYGELKRAAKSNVLKEQALEGVAEGVGVLSRGGDPTADMEDIDEGLVPGF